MSERERETLEFSMLRNMRRNRLTRAMQCEEAADEKCTQLPPVANGKRIFASVTRVNSSSMATGVLSPYATCSPQSPVRFR